jgi:hypothetical protein
LDGKFHGEGLYKWGDEKYFKGKYINGLKEGKGEVGFNDGKKYIINFVNGKPTEKLNIIDIYNNKSIEFDQEIL